MSVVVSKTGSQRGTLSGRMAVTPNLCAQTSKLHEVNQGHFNVNADLRDDIYYTEQKRYVKVINVFSYHRGVFLRGVHTLPRGSWGHAPPGKYLNFNASFQFLAWFIGNKKEARALCILLRAYGGQQLGDYMRNVLLRMCVTTPPAMEGDSHATCQPW